MIRRWTVRSYSPRSGLPYRLGGTTGRYLTYRAALTAATGLNRRLTDRGPDDPIYKPEWRCHPDVATDERGRMGEYKLRRILRAKLRFRQWRSERFKKKVARRLSKAGAR